MQDNTIMPLITETVPTSGLSMTIDPSQLSAFRRDIDESRVQLAIQSRESKLNPSVFDNWLSMHREHQAGAHIALMENDRGQVILPTGTGKTRVQISRHVQEMIDLSKSGDIGTFVITAHRLVLCRQLLEQFIDIAINAGLQFDILFVGSSRFPEDNIYSEYVDRNASNLRSISTTTKSEVRDAQVMAKSAGRHLICVSTYHSFHKLEALDDINVCTYDEAHILVNNTENFLDNVRQVMPKIKSNYFFTATPKVQGETHGMNDTETFGNVLYTMSPRKAVDAGEIVPPKFQIVKTADDGEYRNISMITKTIVDGFAWHKHFLKEHSANPERLGAKMIVSASGNKEMFEVVNDENFRALCFENKVRTFVFSSEFGTFVDFEKKSRTETMNEMQKLEDDEDAILFHIDILTEGIDLPSITGVMPFRELNMIKLMQTIGRASRLYKDDRKRIYDNELVPSNYEQYVKPYAWVILPEYMHINTDVMKDTIKTIINSYEIPKEEFTAIDRYMANKEETLGRITDIDQSTRADKKCDLTHTIEDVLLDGFGETTHDDLFDYFGC